MLEIKPFGSSIETLKNNGVSIITLLISVSALVVSIKSCQISEDARDQSKRQYVDERQLVLQGKFGEDEKEIIISPIDGTMRFLEGDAFLPSSIHNKSIPIREGGKFYHMGDVYYNLVKFVERKVPKEKGSIKIGDGHLPVIIKSYYASKGSAYTDISLYAIRTFLMIYEDETEPPKISFKGLTFLKRLDQEKPVPISMLDEFVENERGFYLPPQPPSK
jgi:hypothetical protein